MPFQLSAGVVITETDLTGIIPAVSTSIGGMVGQFLWGPADEIVSVDSENYLRERYWKPSALNFKDWLSAANFLSYSTHLKLARSVHSDALNATLGYDSNNDLVTGEGQLIKNLDAHEAATYTTSAIVAKYPGALGNSLGFAWADATTFDAVDSNGEPTWAWFDFFETTLEDDEYHIVIYDFDGGITGTAGTILEKFGYISTTEGAKRSDGRTNYLPEVLNNESAWVWVGSFADFIEAAPGDGVQLGGGSNGTALVDADYEATWTLFQDAESVDVNHLITAGASKVVGKWVLDNVAEVRKDLIVYLSPEQSDVVGITDFDTVLDNVIETRNYFGSSSYAMMDSNWKYQYDRYNDVWRWVPLNGDVAGMAARAADNFDAWWNPSGFDRGRIKNMAKFAWTQKKAIRDELYKVGVNPALIINPEGPVLFGDKMLQAKPSAFDRYNVRSVFLVMERAIAIAAKYYLFEFNTEFTRNRFVAQVTPFLRDIRGRFGIEDFKVVCNETNNTPVRRARNEFWADIYIKPVYSINFIYLNFIAVGPNVTFEEVGG